MRIERLRLTNFRAHVRSELELTEGVNFLHGPNGAGKTNVVEAVGFLGLGRSPVQAADGAVLRIGAPFFEVDGELRDDAGRPLRARLAFVDGEGKRAFINGMPLDRLADLVGRVPVVIMSPADYALTAGGPEERRRFLDVTLSQATPAYLDELLRYRRSLRQRNALLHEGRRTRKRPEALAAWDAELVELGSRVIDRRRRFLDAFGPFVSEASRLLEMGGEAARLRYASIAPADRLSDRDAVREEFSGQLARAAGREAARGRTLVGPHLDDIIFQLDDLEVRPFASQGQHRVFGLALRLGAFLYLRSHLGETPLLLLDDVFGPLDPARADALLRLLLGPTLGQSIITAARPEPLMARVAQSDRAHSTIEVRSGTVVPGAGEPGDGSGGADRLDSP